jgi:hypothetical protein
MKKSDEILDRVLEERLSNWFYQPSPYVEQTLKNLYSIYEKDGYPKTWDEFKSHIVGIYPTA